MSLIGNLKEFIYFMLHGAAKPQPKTAEELALEEFNKGVDEVMAEFGASGFVLPEQEPLNIIVQPEEPTPVKWELEKIELDPAETFQLSEKQYERLTKAANEGHVAWSIPYPSLEDDKEHQEKLITLNREIDQLVALDLLRDVSKHHKFIKTVDQALRTERRYVRFFIMTDNAEIMFKDSEQYREADEIKTRKRAIN